ncbi:MAG: PQQ-like beta-propeller repeat protein [Planctomycetaceae bacterium]|nr:PQQ-like beta-propeller repeat protein [Planctomycetaceae bacterium]
MNKPWTVILGLTILLITGPVMLHQELRAEDWNQWRGPSRTGHVTYAGRLISDLPETGIQPVWTTGVTETARDGGWGSPVVADGIVYLFSHKKELVGPQPGPRKFPYLAPENRGDMSDEDYAEYERNRRDEDEQRAKAYRYREFVVAYDAESGKELWSNRSDSTYSRFPQSGCPTIHEGRLYILGAGRQARCLDARTGQELWTTRLPGDFRDEYYQASVLLTGDVAVFNATHLFGLDANDGSIVWTGDPARTAGNHASPVIWEQAGEISVISLTNAGHIVCIDPANGQLKWTTPAEGGQASPVVVGDRLLVYGNSRKKGLHCYRLTPAGAESLWVYQRVTDKGSTPVVVENAVYVQGERKLACVDLETGTALWMANLEMENPQYGSPVAGGNLGFYAYDGLVIFQLRADRYQPVIEGLIDSRNLLAPATRFREQFQLDDNSLDAEGRKAALRKYQQEVGRHGPLKCASPAFANGFLYLRLRDSLVCYDLRGE